MRDRRLRADAAPDRVVSVATYSVQVGASQVVRPGQTVPLLVAVRFVRPGLAAYLDEIVRNPVVRDSQAAGDAVVLLPALVKADAQAVADQTTLLLTSNRSFGDAQAVADQVALLVTVLREFADGQVAADAAVLSLARPLADTQRALDAIARVMAKALGDAQIVADVAALSFARPLADIQAALDAVALAPGKVGADAQAAGDGGFLVSQDYVSPDYFAADYVGVARSF